ncbi:MAG: cation:proton antiporter [Nostocoides sp.]
MDPLAVALLLVAISTTVIIVARLCAPIGLPAPLALLAVGVLASFLPFVPDVDLSPQVVLYLLLPPLLYAAALNTSLIDVAANRVPIIGLSVGLVLFTALGVAVVAHALLPISFGVAFALGAIVAPPDAVAATAVARSIGLPRRVTTILEGESLLNDATALVTLRTAIAAAGLTVAGHGGGGEHVTFLTVARDFGWAVAGGVGIGWLAFLLIGLIRTHLTETAADTALSFAAPFIAYVPAEKVGASGVLAVVTAGLLLAHKAPVLQTAASRLSERINWASLTFLLENSVFLLIGLQMARLISDVRDGDLSMGRTLAVGLLVLLTCLVLRPLWMFPFSWIADRISGVSVPGRKRAVTVSSWAGMRGVVTLAAALTLPDATRHRPVLVMIALIVTVGTLVLQGLSLPALARALDVRGPDPREDALVEATVVQASTAAGLRVIEADPTADAHTVEQIRGQSAARVNRIWERLGTLGASQTETPSEAYRRLRLHMITAERSELLKIRDSGTVDHEILSGVMWQMDAEETALSWGNHKAARLRDAPLRAPDRVAVGCEHLAEEAECAVPRTPEGCGECLALGWTWVHLRLCVSCGNVGCCDSSRGNHATGHFHETAHPVMRSLEPGEAWRWCYVDKVLG